MGEVNLKIDLKKKALRDSHQQAVADLTLIKNNYSAMNLTQAKDAIGAMADHLLTLIEYIKERL